MLAVFGIHHQRSIFLRFIFFICNNIIQHFLSESFFFRHNTGWAIKKRTCLSDDKLITQRWLPIERRVICQKFQNVVDRRPNLHSKSFKYSLPNLHKSSLPLKLGICMHSHVPEFIEFKNLLPKSPDLNSVNYSVWGHCNRQHGHKISVTDQLKRVLIECWAQLFLNTLIPAIDQLPKRTDDGYE